MRAVIRSLIHSFFVLVVLLAGDASPVFAQARMVVSAPDEVRELIAPAVHSLDVSLESIDPLERLAAARRARGALREALEAEGWFSPQIDLVLEPAPRLDLSPGVRTVVGSIEIVFLGPVSDEPERMATLRAHFAMAAGAPFRQPGWEAAKNRLLQALGSEDYAAARINSSLATVDPATGKAALNIVLDSGPAFSLGTLNVSGLSRYSPSLVARFNPFKSGDRFSQTKLLEFQSALQAAPYFASVVVEVNRDPDAPRDVPITVEVVEAKSQRISAGVGASTNYGPRAELNYRDNNWLDRALGLGIGARVDNLRVSEFAEVFFPLRDNRVRDSLGVLREDSDIQGLSTKRVAFGANREWSRGKLETRISINAQQETRSGEGVEMAVRNALSLGGSWTWRDVDNPLDPRRGFVINAQAGGGSKLLLSDQNFLRGYAHAQQYWPVGALDVFSIRAELGVTAALDREGLPQEFLFRAGGAQSVRGYAYESLGVREGNAIVGGRFMAVGSAEYTHWLNPKWGVAGFVDAGNVTDTRESFRFLYGTGLGARWRSPAGPLAFDLAYGERDRKVRAHFAIMIAF